MTDDELNTLFDAARANPPQVPDALHARVLQDALAVQQRAPLLSGWRGWFRTLGGAPGVGGLVSAACVGFWIGVAPPQGMPDLAGIVLGTQNAQVTESEAGDGAVFGWELEEG